MLVSELLNEGYKEAQSEFSLVAGEEVAKEIISKYQELVDKNQVHGSERNIDYWRKQVQKMLHQQHPLHLLPGRQRCRANSLHW